MSLSYGLSMEQTGLFGMSLDLGNYQIKTLSKSVVNVIRTSAERLSPSQIIHLDRPAINITYVYVC